MKQAEKEKSHYYVLYSKMGKIERDIFPTLNQAIIDFKAKIELDKSQLFDDRFVIGIEDASGNKITLD